MEPEITLADAADLLGRLVACASVNPNGAVLEPPCGEERLADLLQDYVKDWGGTVRLQPVAPGRPNFLATFSGPQAGRVLLFDAHSDTVPALGRAGFEPRVADGRLYGRGACDCKGAMAAMLLGLRAALRSGRPLPATVCFAATCDEESSAGGARALVREGLWADLAVVGEPTDLQVLYAHKGAVRWKVRARGVAAHSADPSKGVNAITHMARVVEWIEQTVAPGLKSVRHPVLGEPTISIGTIRGGSRVNIVPADCEIEIDRRLLPSENEAETTARFRREVEELAARTPGMNVSVEATQYYPALGGMADAGPARLVRAACEAVLGGATVNTAPWASNAGIYHEAGLPCVLFGPGSIRHAHTEDEHIELGDVVAAARVYAEIIRLSGAEPA